MKTFKTFAGDIIYKSIKYSYTAKCYSIDDSSWCFETYPEIEPSISDPQLFNIVEYKILDEINKD